MSFKEWSCYQLEVGNLSLDSIPECLISAGKEIPEHRIFFVVVFIPNKRVSISYVKQADFHSENTLENV